jgi:hypothetical protein
MDYLLVVLTHGADPEPLRRTLTAFHQHVRPLPTEGAIYCDGIESFSRSAIEADRNDWTEWILDVDHVEPQGFCATTRAAWGDASGATADREGVSAGAGEHPHVFWLEHDFEITRPVDLAELAGALDSSPRLAQMALMRNAVNDQERAAGGLYESRPGEYEQRRTRFWQDERLPAASKEWTASWLEHRSYLTTNPSLMRRDFMAENPWPAYESECEGRFGIDLVARGYSFGVWGDGEPWCRHAGERNGFGY